MKVQHTPSPIYGSYMNYHGHLFKPHRTIIIICKSVWRLAYNKRYMNYHGHLFYMISLEKTVLANLFTTMSNMVFKYAYKWNHTNGRVLSYTWVFIHNMVILNLKLTAHHLLILLLLLCSLQLYQEDPVYHWYTSCNMLPFIWIYTQ